MKITVKENKEGKSSKVFPILMESTSTNNIYLFLNPREAIPLVIKNGGYEIGERIEADFYNALKWVRFCGAITLEND